MNDTQDFITTYKQEENERLNTDFNSLCKYGIPVLDEPLMAIAKNELVVIGADSGIGKSTLGLHIARHNARHKKKVALFYLEGGHLEAMQRLKFSDICEYYFNRRSDYGHLDLDYRRWSLNNLTDDERLIFNRISSEVFEKSKTLYQDNLYFYPVKNDFKIDNLIDSLLGFHKLTPDKYGNFSHKESYDLDLIIIDHLQYFSLNQTENEITEITKIIREVKKITDHYRIPVILISHLRKKSKDRGFPDQEDFYGSSNIPKISTTSITIAPYYEGNDLANNIYATFFRICKSRSGIKPNLAFLCHYDLSHHSYSQTYMIHKINSQGIINEDALNITELPTWAKGAK